ncbi:MAG: SHOCT domain-containing protein [Thiogranum sp.]|nr:SHOCT domain-containing protein [Thiogranum sp.]
MFHTDGGMVFGGFFMWIFWLLVVILTFAAIWYLATNTSGGRRSSGPPEEDALEILRKRYARGEIGSEEYQQRRQELEK